MNLYPGLLAASLLGQHPFAPSVSSSRCETSHLNSLPQFAVSAEEEATMSSRSAFPPNSTATPMPLLPPLPPTGLIGPLFAFRQSLGLNHAQTCLPNFSSSSSTSPSASSSSSSSSSSSPSSSSGYLGLPLELATSASSGMAPWASLSLSSAVQLNSLASAAVAAHNLLANSGLGQSASATGDASDLTVAFATASSGSTSICQSGIVSATPLPGPVEASDSEALSTVATETPEPATTLSPHDATWCMSGGQHGATRNYGPSAGDRMTGCYIPSEDRATKRLTSLTTVDEAVGVSATTSMTTSKSPAYCTPNPVPNVPENNQVRLIEFRGERLAAFSVEGRELVCLPQAFELFLKHLVGGLHTVYTKLKRLEIIPIVCNVEQASE